MSRATLRAYVIAIDLAAILVTALLPTIGLTRRPWAFGLLLVLAAAVGTRSVRLHARKIRLTAGDAFTFCALEIAGPMAAPLVALLGTAGAAFGSRPRTSFLRTAFNLGAVTLAAAACAWAREVILALDGPEAMMRGLALLGAAAVFFLVNTLLVAGAIRIDTGKPFLAVWNRTGLWTFGSTVASLVLGAGLFWFVETVGPLGLALGLGGAAVVSGFFRSRKDPTD